MKEQSRLQKNSLKIHIFVLALVGMVEMIGCGKAETMESNSTNTVVESTHEMQTVLSTENPGETKHETDSAGETESEGETEIPDETVLESELAEVQSQTVECLLRTALLPVGSTMYVWGGGWNEEDTGAGPGATTLGTVSQWAEFAALCDEDYNYKDHKYEILNGLDCSGYVGWVVYNVFEEEEGKEGYVFKSTDTAKVYSELGWGELLENPAEFLPGDVVSMKGHVWISLGMCEDGSTVLLHASPPGVSICGTPGEGEDTGEAVRLAENYMTAYYPAWQDKYPKRDVKASYKENVTVLRWNSETLSDAEKWQKMSAEEVLKQLFEE